MTTAPHDNTAILPPLALALVNHPRATLQELAKAIGISKATLYRFCPTRDLLIKRLLEQSLRTLDDALNEARIEEGPVLEALKRLNAKHLEHREFTLFLTYYWNEVEKPMEENAIWEPKVDAFFLRGQQEGVFRIDFSAATLTELWLGTVIALIDGERRGRIPRAPLAQLAEQAFLQGVMRQDGTATA